MSLHRVVVPRTVSSGVVSDRGPRFVRGAVKKGINMSTARMVMPVLNIGKLSDDRFKFCFVTNTGTLFSEVSVLKAKDGLDSRSEDQKRIEALRRLKMIAKELDSTIMELDAA